MVAARRRLNWTGLSDPSGAVILVMLGILQYILSCQVELSRWVYRASDEEVHDHDEDVMIFVYDPVVFGHQPARRLVLVLVEEPSGGKR
jgi:hypothetical protein